MASDVEHLLIALRAIHKSSFVRYRNLCPFFKKIGLSYWLSVFDMYSGYKSFVRYLLPEYFLPCDLPFHILMASFDKQKF